MDIKTYTCKICSKDYKSYKSLWYHKYKYHSNISPEYPQNIPPISPLYHHNIPNISTNAIIKKTDKTICDYCNKQMSSYKNLNRHLKTCKIKEKKLLEYEDLKQEHEEMKKAFEELKSMMSEMMNNKCKLHPKKFQKLINSTNNSNNNSNNNLTINNQINNNQINIIALGDENLNDVFSKEEKLKILQRGYSSLEEIIKHAHLNDKYIQFQNIIITNKRSNDAYVYNSDIGKFILCDKKEILEELIIYRMDDLIEFYNEYKNKLDPKIVKILEDMFYVRRDDDKYIDRKTNDFNVLFYNLSNKDLIKYKKNDDIEIPDTVEITV
jgi:hypothetical protein